MQVSGFHSRQADAERQRELEATFANFDHDGQLGSFNELQVTIFLVPTRKFVEVVHRSSQINKNGLLLQMCVTPRDGSLNKTESGTHCLELKRVTRLSVHPINFCVGSGCHACP